jgi:prepilin-type N-terminal cleavage/methylation domain-containing protein
MKMFRAKYLKRERGFTLIELLTVIAIIGILATIIVVSYINAQAKSRDNKRRADVQAIASAHQLMYQDSKKWFVPGTGYNGNGRGWFNYYGGSYPDSIAHGLEINKYIDSAPKDPKMTDDHGIPSGNYQYMVYGCDGGVRVFARLEHPTSSEIADAQKSTPTCTYYGYNQNYSVIVK